jgi:Transglycosylase SLT domain
MTSRKPEPGKEITISLFAKMPPHLLVPLTCPPAVARSAGQGRFLDRRLGALPLRGTSTMAGWRNAGRIVLSAIVALCVTLQPGASVYAQPAAIPAQPPRTNAADPLSGFVSDAAHRFSIPEPWIRAVMQAESGGDASAVSPKGAMGLMQIMPDTYAGLRATYGLGTDPFVPRDNILAGAAYLREMYDRYGLAGFLAAYNCGPACYDDHLATGRPLPAETRAYVAALTPLIAGGGSFRGVIAPTDPDVWQRAPLFVALGRGMMAADRLQSGGHMNTVPATGFAALEPSNGGHPGHISNNAALFIPVAVSAAE